jgi:hypothetical protein
MATTIETAKPTADKAVAVARRAAQVAQIKPEARVGPEYLLAGVIKSVGDKVAASHLRAAGVKDVRAILAAVPDASAEDAATLPPLKPDSDLARLIKGPLAPFLAGKEDGETALKTLLDPENRVPGVRRFLTEPQWLTISRQTAVPETVSTRDLLKRLTYFYQRRHYVGELYYSPRERDGCSDFSDGSRDRSFLAAVDELYADEVAAHETIFNQRLYRSSPVGRCWDEHGELAAHVLGIAVLAELGLVGGGAPRINEVIWTIDPKYFHRNIGPVRRVGAALRDGGLIRLIPRSRSVRLFQRIIPADDVVDEFTEFLRDNDPISADEQADALKRIFLGNGV